MRGDRHVVTLAAGLLLSVVIPRLLVFPVMDLGPDEVAYALIGRELLEGHWPYTTAYDHKPGALYVPYALSELVFGPSLTALRVMPIIAVGVGYCLVYACARRLGVLPLPAVLVASMFGAMTIGNDGLAALSEHLLNAYILTMVLALLAKPRAVTALMFGAAMALAFHTNYIAGPVIAVMGIFFLWRERRAARQWLAAGSGFVAVSCAVLLPIALWADLAYYFRLQYQFLRGYQAAEAAWAVEVQRLQRFLAPSASVVALCVLLAVIARRTGRSTSPWFALLALATFVVSSNGFYWPHYTLLLAPVIAMLLASQLRDFPGRQSAIATVALVTAVGFIVLPTVSTLSAGLQVISRQRSLSADVGSVKYRTALEVRRLAPTGSVIYTRDLHIYYLAGAALPTRFFFPSHHLDPTVTALRHTTPDREMRKILAGNPRVVVLDEEAAVPASKDAILLEYLARACVREKVIGTARVYVCGSGGRAG